jgi:hypothetical protein
MRHRVTQLILPFEPALPDRGLILVPRLWLTMTRTIKQQLAKRVAQLLRSVLAAAGDLSGGYRRAEFRRSSEKLACESEQLAIARSRLGAELPDRI